MSDGRRLDQYVALDTHAVEQEIDLGWAVGILHADRTFTRSCKGCGVSATTAVDNQGEVAQAEIHHLDGCPVVERLGNNPALS